MCHGVSMKAEPKPLRGPDPVKIGLDARKPQKVSPSLGGKGGRTGTRVFGRRLAGGGTGKQN